MPYININPPVLTDKHLSRYWNSVDKSLGFGPKGNCWEWKAFRPDDNYGRFSVYYQHKTRTYLAHRLAYFLNTGVWSGRLIMHRCDNPPCVNPAHLQEGTDLDNALDKKVKGRCSAGDKSGPRKHPERIKRGEQLPQTKLTAPAVLEIRRLYASGNYSTRTLAQRYSMSQSVISGIVSHRRWKHI